MQNRFIMTAFGKDRPGIVADVTRMLYENGCNLEDTAMTMLADEFTLNLLFSCNQEGVEETLLQECERLDLDKEISAFIRPLPARQAKAPRAAAAATIHVEGLDQAGIVYKISQYLAKNAVNIVDLKSQAQASPESGTAVYLMDIHVQLPAGTALRAIEEGLATVADELHVEISLSQG
ncbi:amino acid-binding protein [Desulfuromonas versatilis]|uniref:Amino acid-binding protein n=1 Tax=Desulfuromonas versatilis TaxID=2802975 RepID=A0ABN6DVR9_9BACT|nr:ACT domain-containing protein [Desulfuromonas versatilis]BCR04248.1 amino acid-binding protein [Desulfuromonas versatilis]